MTAAYLVVATPVVAAATDYQIRRATDDVAAVMVPEDFYAVGQWYEDFSQTSDHEVHELLTNAARRQRVEA